MRPSSTSILLGEYHDIPKSMHLKVNQGVGITLKKRGPQSLLYLYLCSCCATIRFLAFGNLLIKISITSLLD